MAEKSRSSDKAMAGDPVVALTAEQRSVKLGSVAVQVLSLHVRAPVYSGERPAGEQDLRPVQVVREEDLPAGVATTVHDVLLEVRETPPVPAPVKLGA